MNPTTESLPNRLRRVLHSVAEGFFHNKTTWAARWLNPLVLVGLFVFGLFQLGGLLNWGNIPFNHLDWLDITGPRLSLMQDAAKRLVLPLHTAEPEAMKGVTDRFLAIPDVILSPQVLLLRYLDPGPFALIHTLLLYTIGFGGLLALRWRFNLSPAVFVPLYLLFNFNGHIVSHLAVGHLSWGGYFLLPFLILLVVRLLEGERSWRWALHCGLWLLAVFLQGSFHLFVWTLVFLSALALFQWSAWKTILAGLAAGVLFSLFRILPAALVSGDLAVEFVTGFTTSGHLLRGLAELRKPVDALVSPAVYDPLTWEFNFYVGWAGLALIVGFGIFYWLRRPDLQPALRPLYGPLLVLAVLSLGQVYRVIFQAGIPLFAGERISSRFFVLPLAFGLFLAVLGLQAALDQRREKPAWVRLLLAGGILVLLTDLEAHRQTWTVLAIDAAFPPEIFPQALAVANRPDPPYLWSMGIGLLVGLAALAFLVVQTRREGHKSPREPYTIPQTGDSTSI